MLFGEFFKGAILVHPEHDVLAALGREFDGKIAGLNIPETSIGFDNPALRPADFTNDGYAASIREITTGAATKARVAAR